MEYFQVAPESVRALGNIVMDDPYLIGYIGIVESSTDAIHGETMPVCVFSFSAADSVELSYSFIEVIEVEDETEESEEESENDGI